MAKIRGREGKRDEEEEEEEEEEKENCQVGFCAHNCFCRVDFLRVTLLRSRTLGSVTTPPP